MAKTCPLCGTTFPDSAIFCLHDGTSLRTLEESDNLINQTFCDRYVVTECLGQGGMGAVYLARDVRLPQKVAIKVLRERTATDPALVARFRQEAALASQINHDRVARVFDFGFMEDGRAYIVMEYADGQTLRQLMDDGPLEPRVAATITVMIAEGLNAAHRLGILHRDLKPENVMILDDGTGHGAKNATPARVDGSSSESNSGIRVKVLDFGIAKVLNTDEGEVRTEAGFVIGTPLWMSPEQLLAEPLDARSDVFALGLLAFSMLTGVRAFTGGTKQAEMMAPLSSTPRSLKDMAPTVEWPPALQSLLDRTLARNASDRPSSALEFANEMARILNSASTSAPALIIQPPIKKTNPFLIAGGIAATLLVAAIVMSQLKKDDSAISTPAGDSAGAVSGSAAPSIPSTASTTTPPPATNTGPPNASVAASENAKQPALPTTPTKRDSTAPAISNATVEASGVAPEVAKLRRLMNEADESISTGLSAESKATRARQLLRDLETLKLTASADKGWAALYKGMMHATLTDKAQACSEFDLASKSGSGSKALKENTEQWQIQLGCPP